MRSSDAGRLSADGRPRGAAGVDDATVGQGDVEADGHVLDLAVAVGQLTRRPARQPAPDGGQGDGLGPVAHGHPVFGPQGVLQLVTEGPGGHVEDHRGGVHRADAGQGAEVEQDTAVDGHRAPADPAAAGGGGDGHPGLVADARELVRELARVHHRGVTLTPQAREIGGRGNFLLHLLLVKERQIFKVFGGFELRDLVRLDSHRNGTRAFEVAVEAEVGHRLLDLIQIGTQPPRQVLMGTELVVRESCGFAA